MDHPEKLDDGKKGPTYEDWEMRIRMKLRADSHLYESSERRLVYVISRTTGASAGHIYPRTQDSHPDVYETEEDVFKHLKTIFQDPHRKATAKYKLKL